jgi:hypothetical protein
MRHKPSNILRRVFCELGARHYSVIIHKVTGYSWALLAFIFVFYEAYMILQANLAMLEQLCPSVRGDE